MEELRFEKFFLTSSWNLEIVSLHIASNWQKFCLLKVSLPIQMQPIQMQLYRKLEVFLLFFQTLWNSHPIFNIMKQKISLIADLFIRL